MPRNRNSVQFTLDGKVMCNELFENTGSDDITHAELPFDSAYNIYIVDEFIETGDACIPISIRTCR